MPYIKTIKMDVDKFIKIAGNPQQRNTEYHAKSASQQHLKKYHESHTKVAIAICGKIQWKLDGHTRSYLWDLGLLKAPKDVFVDIWEVKNKDEATKLYETYDNKFAVESVADKVSGALRLMGINNANKSFCRNAGIPAAVNIINKAIKKFNPNKTVSENLTAHKKEIKRLIEMQWHVPPAPSMGRPGTPSCVIAAFIITYNLYGEGCVGFWDGYYSGKGKEMFKSRRDGSLAAAEWVIRARKNKELMGSDMPKNIAAILNGFEYYWDEKIVKDIRSLYKGDYKKSHIGQLSDVLKKLGYF